MEVSRSRHMLSSSHFMLALFTILAHSVSLASTSCNSLRVLSGTTDVTDQVCKKEYLLEDCLSFAHSHNASDLPDVDVFARQFEVERPRQLYADAKLIPYDKTTEKVYYPAIDFSWTSPYSGVSRRDLKGFYLELQSVDVGDVDIVCRVFGVDHSSMNQQLEFQYDLEKVSYVQGRNYSVKVYSLPLRKDETEDWMKVSKSYQALLVTTHDPYFTALDKILYPTQWYSSISVRPNLMERSIDVWFTFPDPSLGFEFTDYQVDLIDTSLDASNPIEPGGTKHFFVDPSSNVTRGHANFTNVPLSGWYRASVSMVDAHPRDRKNCQCYMGENFLGRSCEISCPISRSAIFDMNFDVTGNPSEATHAPFITTSPATPTGDDTKVGSSVNKDSTDDSEDYMFGVLYAFVSVIVAGVLFGISYLVFRWKYQNIYCKPAKSQVPPFGRDGLRVISVITRRSSLRQRTVFLLSSSDHEYHQEMMRQFKMFLQTHCRCKVIDDSDLDASQSTGIAPWLMDKFSKCDLIILFDSTGANRRLKAYLNNQEYYSVESGLHRDVFNMGLRHIYNVIIEKHQSDKAIIVSLTEERMSELVLGSLKECVLPRDLSFFQGRLHNLKSDYTGYKSQLPMLHEFQEELPHVSDLLQSIKATKTYEAENPDWFSKHFQLISPEPNAENTGSKPNTERHISIIDSSYGSMDGSVNRSITPPLGSSTNSSPISTDSVLPAFLIDAESCTTVVTEYPGDDIKPPYNGGVVPPRNELEFDVENTSTAIGHFNQSGNGEASYTIVPPCNESQIYVDNLSTAIGDLNQNEAVDKNPSRHKTSAQPVVIKPPRALSDCDVDNSSVALGAFNASNVIGIRSYCAADGGDGGGVDQRESRGKKLNPPPDDMSLDDLSVSLSDILSNRNSDFGTS